MTLKIGDIITVTSFVQGGNYRVVFLYPDEPAMALITPVDDYQAQPRCHHALLADCVLVESREPPKQQVQRKPEVERPSILQKFSRVTDEKDTLPREYRQEGY